ncbi:MAG: hypothetical protein GF333_07470 [Candidatus Omnitrophica bacterium]|nr:hypothetical protein [Candidatus Omnitrophota bacterium]
MRTLGILFLGVFLCMPAVTGSAQSNEETITFTTYYPSPYGVYRELRSQRMVVGENYYQNDQYCWEEECPQQISGTQFQDIDFVVEGSAVIGGYAPTGNARLTVSSNDTTFPSGIVIRGNESNQPGFGRAAISFQDLSTNTHWNVFNSGTASHEGPRKLNFNLGLKDGIVLHHNVLMLDGNNESVGIGMTTGSGTPQAKLDVRGGVKISDDSDTCTAAKAGTMRYNSTSKIMEFCNGTVWGPVSGTSNVQMNSGIYTGSGGGWRTIDVGFKPKIVMLLPHGQGPEAWSDNLTLKMEAWPTSGTMWGGGYKWTPQYIKDAEGYDNPHPNPPYHHSGIRLLKNGFETDYNTKSRPYSWIAFGW